MSAVRVEVIGPEKHVRPYWKCVRQNRCELMTKTILLLPKFVLSKWVMKVNILRANFTIQANCPMQRLLQSPTHYESKERNLTPNEDARNFLRSQQANRWLRKQLSQINCPIIDLWNKRTVSRQSSFLVRHQIIYRGSKARKPKK